MSLLKISTCALCLGTVLGISSMAMERNGEECQQEVSEQVQILETNREKEEKSEKYLKFYNDLMTKGKLKEEDARKQAEIFEKELKNRKSFIYAQYYSMLRVVRKLDAERAMFQSEVFEREFRKEKNFRKADYYATIAILHNLKAMRMANLEKEIRSSRIINKDDKLIKKALKIAKEEIESGKSCFYVRRYVDLIIDNIMEKTARRSAEIVDVEMKEGRSYYYASAYSVLKSNGVSENEINERLEIVDRELTSGRGYNYAVRYAELIFDKKLPEDRARKNAELVEKEVGESIKNYFYGIKFADLIENGMSEAEARRAAKMIARDEASGKSQLYLGACSKLILDNIDESIVRKEAEFIEKLILEGKDYEYAIVYADVVVRHKQSEELAEELANAATKEVKSGKSSCYARQYAKLTVIAGKKEDYARKEAEIFESMLDRKKRNGRFVEAYAELVTELKLPDDIARRAASLTEKETKSGKPYWLSLYYAKLIVVNKEEESYARKEAAIADQEMDEGKSENYATRYARLILRGVPEKEAREGAEELDKMTEAGKKYYYAERYLDLISTGVSEEIAAKEAEIYYQDKKAKGYCFE